MKWKIKLTKWGWSLFYEGDLVSSADNPMSLVGYTLFAREHSNPSFN
jgi:hypothetical protein